MGKISSRAGGVGRGCLALMVCGLLLGCAADISQERGKELSAAGQWEEAVRYYLEAVSRDQRNLDLRLALARAMHEASKSLLVQAQELEKAGRLDEAALAYRRALGYNSENTAAQDGLTRLVAQRQVLEKLGIAKERMQKAEWRAAQAEVAAALRLDPDNPQARELQRQIQVQLRAELAAPKVEAESDQAAALLFSTQPVTLRFRDTDIKEVLEVFARTSGINIFTDETLPAKRVTTFFKDLPLRQAFNLILTANRLFAKRVAENTVIVVPDNPGKRQQYDSLVVQTFYLTDADAKVAVNLLRTILNTRQVFVNERLNALVVRETPDKVELARKLLAANDRSPGEVEIDVEVMEVSYTSLQNLGIDISPRSLAVTFSWQALSISNITEGLALGTLTVPPTSLILNLIKTDGNTRILANPTIRVIDRQKARLLIGERRPFLISALTSVPATAGAPTTGQLPTGAVTTTETRTEYRDVGLKVTLSPIVHLNGEVTIEINFEISAVGPPISGVTGGELLVPVITRNLDTFVKAKNGETRLLGGLLQQSMQDTNNPIPLLGEIPGFGRLFSSGNKERRTNDVLISFTPRIVKALERPDPDIENFLSGTADSFGPPVPVPVAPPPAPAVPPAPRPAPPPPGGSLPGGGPSPGGVSPPGPPQ